ncbi:hypothetical protein [Mycobacteroides abscessus]|uniref:hypothetical protein n=1 Tax=Mycobacteroides abscessus TaxID=36809 RepID=UPI0009A7A106|nr:hypothetical protein [Mycobacteroides abscessus]SLC86428.1 Uncharacterised protein [Mycobacteroides abscessus subsp. abscessus]SLG74971.1 Uncharacterised protein [Mycobacteroides abscessus subsp. abscessus]
MTGSREAALRVLGTLQRVEQLFEGNGDPGGREAPDGSRRIDDVQGGVRRLPDPSAPVIKSAPTYPMSNPDEPDPMSPDATNYYAGPFCGCGDFSCPGGGQCQ